MNDAGQYLAHMRARAPLVQNITNYVAMNVMANIMLAAGASPAMAHAQQEAAEFAGLASALSVNIGTLDPEWVVSMEGAARAMNAAGKPWVLDPVAVGATALRRDAGARLLALKPTIIRGNASEIIALAGFEAAGKGADTADAVSDAEAAARALAGQTGGVVAVTGGRDFITDGRAAYRVAGGHALMPRVTEDDIPFLGCCYGIGILGKHLGAPVAKGRYGEAVGTADCTVTQAGRNDALLADLPGRFDAFVGHKEALEALPDGCVHLVSAPSCPFQMVRYKSNVYATQFHPEADSAGFEQRIKTYKDHGYFPPEEALDLIAMCRAADVHAPQKILRNFVQRYG
jgi:hydroxyethylthiazole kinase